MTGIRIESDFPLWEHSDVRIVSGNTLLAFAGRHPETKPALSHWLKIARAADWSNPSEVTGYFARAKVLSGERVRFEVAGGNYRLIVSFDFGRRIAYVKFLGSHAEYDRIDALNVSMF